MNINNRRIGSLVIASVLLVSLLVGCSSDNKSTTEEKHVPTAKVNLLGVSVFTNDTVYSGNEKIIVTLTNNSNKNGVFKVDCEPVKGATVPIEFLEEEDGGYGIELKQGQTQKIVFYRQRSNSQKGMYHVIVKTAIRHNSPLELKTLKSVEFELK